jgi:hypothetical protein
MLEWLPSAMDKHFKNWYYEDIRGERGSKEQVRDWPVGLVRFGKFTHEKVILERIKNVLYGFRVPRFRDEYGIRQYGHMMGPATIVSLLQEWEYPKVDEFCQVFNIDEEWGSIWTID